MMNYPREIQLKFQRHTTTGLIAAFSDDLPGLLLTGRSHDEINREAPLVIAALIKERYGVNVEVECESDAPVAPGFRSEAPCLAHVREMAAA